LPLGSPNPTLYSAHERFIEPDPSFCWISSAVQLAAIQSLMNRRQ